MNLPDEPKSRDLPVIGISQPAQHPAPMPRRPSSEVVATQAGPIVTVLSENCLDGRWQVPPTTTVVQVMGTTRLDLREADISGSTVVIEGFSLFAELTVIVPIGSRVRTEGVTVFAEKKVHRSSSVSTGPQDVVLDVIIRPHVLFSEVKVYELAPGEKTPGRWESWG